MSEVKRYGYLGIVEEEDGEVVKWEDYAELKAQRDALAAENAARGEIIERLIGQYGAAGYHAIQNSLNPAQSLLYDAMQVLKQPATGAYLNSVRADELGKVAALINLSADKKQSEGYADYARDRRDLAVHFLTMAHQLRAGKAGE